MLKDQRLEVLIWQLRFGGISVPAMMPSILRKCHEESV